MKKLLWALAVAMSSSFAPALGQAPELSQPEKQARVLLLGTFHFAYPNEDILTIPKSEQIDVTSPENQRQIERLVQQVTRFRPSRIAVEAMTHRQGKIDSLYQAYLAGAFKLPVGETFQLGFRLARLLGHQRVYCIDTWGHLDAFGRAGRAGFEVHEGLKDRMERFWDFQEKAVQARAAAGKQKKRPSSLYQLFRQINHPDKIRRDHAAYFGEVFQYEEQPYDYTGVDWYTASWHSRNLRIFRNIQRITTKPDERILVIYGSGHLALLQQAIESSPTHKLVPARKYLR